MPVSKKMKDRKKNKDGINAMGEGGGRAITLVAELEDENLELMKLIIGAGADLSAKNENGDTALLLAAKGEEFELAELLIREGADLDSRDGEGNTALFCAVEADDFELVNLFLKAGADVDALSKYGVPSLTIASYRGLFDIVKLLCHAGADVNVKGPGGYSLLSYAGNSEVLGLLIAQGASLAPEDNAGVTPLMHFSRVNMCERVELEINNGADINYQDPDGDSALSNAIHRGHDEVVEILLRHGVDPNLPVRDGFALTLALACKNISIAKLLVESGADVNKQDAQKNTALHCAVGAPCHEKLKKGSNCASDYSEGDALRFLLAHGANLNARNDEGKTPSMYAVDDADCLELLIDAGAKIGARDNARRSALDYAKKIDDNEEAVSLLKGQRSKKGKVVTHSSGTEIKKNRRGDTEARNEDGDTPLLEALRNKKGRADDIVEELIESGANVNVKGRAGESALYLAASTGKGVLVKTLIEAGASIETDDNSGATRLMLYAAAGMLNEVNREIVEGAVVNSVTKEGFHALGMALYSENLEMVKALLEKGANPNKRFRKINGLIYAAQVWNDKLGRLLIEYGADVNKSDAYGNVPLHFVSSDSRTDSEEAPRAGWGPRKREDLLRMLLKHGADPNIRNKKGKTPLLNACGYHPSVKALLDAGADANIA
ncbi:ankyrin repeat domain-containing protein, partial [Myxococcota bacterium]|nr:ankyrin repeat domain-containing protein [Myxococcota bacterium]